jgi:hypothetical protein
MAQTVRLRRSSVSGQKPTNTNLQLGEIALNTSDGKAFMAVSGSLGPSVEEFILTNTVNTGSLHLIGDVTASSFFGDASGLSNVPFNITGSDVDGNNFNKQFTKLHFDSETGLNVSESAPGTAFISIGSHFRDIFISGSGMLRATGSDAFEIIPDGGIEVTVQNTDTNTNGYTKELIFSTTELSSSLNSRMDVITGSINDLSSSVNDHLTSLDNFTSSVVLSSETSSMTVLSASYAVTAAFALNAGGGGGSAIGSYKLLDQSIAATTWSFQHNMGQRYPIFQIFDENGDVIIPTQIRTIDENNAEIVFGSEQSGTAIASLGGGNGITEEFTNSSLWVVDHYLNTDYPDVTIWDSNRNIIFPDRIESVNANQIKVHFSVPVSGHVSVSRGGHLISGSFDLEWDNILNKPEGIISGSELENAIEFTGSNVTIKGDLLVKGTETKVDSTTIQIGDNIIELNGTGATNAGLVVRDDTNPNTISGSLLWNSTNDYWVAGPQGGEERIILEGEFNTFIESLEFVGRYLHTQTTSSDTWTIEHDLGYSYPNVTVYDGSTNKVMLPSDITSIDDNTTEVTFAVPEHGYALVSVGGLLTSTADRFLFTTSTATGSWVIDHNLGFQYPNIDVYDQNDEQLIPQKVTAVSINRTQIDFATPTSGNAIITVGGPRSTSIFNQTGSFYNTQYDIGITGSLVVTGDVDASSFNTTSDKMLKTNLERIEGSLDKIQKLNGYTFDWIEGYSEDKSKQIGMIANEVYEVQPELISKRTIMLGGKEEEIMLLDYSKVTALLIEGIKELKDRVSKLENKRK